MQNVETASHQLNNDYSRAETSSVTWSGLGWRCQYCLATKDDSSIVAIDKVNYREQHDLATVDQY